MLQLQEIPVEMQEQNKKEFSIESLVPASRKGHRCCKVFLYFPLSPFQAVQNQCWLDAQCSFFPRLSLVPFSTLVPRPPPTPAQLYSANTHLAKASGISGRDRQQKMAFTVLLIFQSGAFTTTKPFFWPDVMGSCGGAAGAEVLRQGGA